MRASGEFPTLAAAQLEIAKHAGFPSWPKIKLHCEQLALCDLIEDGDVEGVRAFLSKSPKMAATPFADGSWPLHLAAGHNQTAIVELLVRAGAALHPKYATSAHTALSWAVTCWSFGAAKKLMELG